MRCRLRTVNGPLRTVCHFPVHTIRTDRNIDYTVHTRTYFIVTFPKGLFRNNVDLKKQTVGWIVRTVKVRVYWTTLGEGGGRITLPSLVAPAIGHLFLIIEGRVRRVGHFIKKTTRKQNYNEK